LIARLNLPFIVFFVYLLVTRKICKIIRGILINKFLMHLKIEEVPLKRDMEIYQEVVIFEGQETMQTKRIAFEL